MTQDNFYTVLKQVSRSFYLSIRVLPIKMRKPVAIAYLLARAADSIADNDQLSFQQRLLFLQKLLEALTINDVGKVTELANSLTAHISDINEKKLMEKLSVIIQLYFSLPNNDKFLVLDVVKTLIDGMKMDLDTFNHSGVITALNDHVTLDKYTYLVAGCVGEFWTKIALTHLPEVSHWNENTQTQLGIKFGKALQLTNILRDIAKDAKMERCYLPFELLKQHNLSTEMLRDKKNDNEFRPIVFQHLAQTLTYFEAAETYLLNTPRTSIRLRLASLWPILIGLKTLELISNNENFLDINKNIKVQRNWVYKMLFRSCFTIHSNTLVRNWIQKIRKNILHKMTLKQ